METLSKLEESSGSEPGQQFGCLGLRTRGRGVGRRAGEVSREGAERRGWDSELQLGAVKGKENWLDAPVLPLPTQASSPRRSHLPSLAEEFPL